ITAARRWRNTDNTFLSTLSLYDDTGNVIKTADPGGHVTSFGYADNWNGLTGCVSGSTFAYRTQSTNALNQAVQNSYYPCTGQVQTARDQNDINAGRSGTTQTYDLLNRPLVTNFPDGGQTSISYNSDALPLTVTRTVLATPSPNIVTSTV